MSEFVADIMGLDAYAKELTTFADTLAGLHDPFTWAKPDTGRWALHNSRSASSTALTTKFQDRVAARITSLVTDLTAHSTAVSDTKAAYETADATASTAYSTHSARLTDESPQGAS